MSSINIAVVGVGNCASSLVQGLSHYREGANETVGLMHWDLGGYRPSDIKVVAAWDVDRRKVGKDVAEAIFAKPNCTTVFCESMKPLLLARNCARSTASPVPTTKAAISARNANLKVAVQPSPMRSHSAEKFSLLGSMIGPQRSMLS